MVIGNTIVSLKVSSRPDLKYTGLPGAMYKTAYFLSAIYRESRSLLF